MTVEFTADDLIRIKKAEELARYFHGDVYHRRKFSGEPYVDHLREVAEKMARFFRSDICHRRRFSGEPYVDHLREVAEKMARFFRSDICHRRRFSGEPYVYHLREVAETVQEVGGTVEMIQAAWCHDLVEDTQCSLNTIRMELGNTVASYVYYLTNTPPTEGMNRRDRISLDRQKLVFAPEEVFTIKLADTLSNFDSIVEHSPEFAKLWVAEKAALFKIYQKGNGVLRARLNKKLELYYASSIDNSFEQYPL